MSEQYEPPIKLIEEEVIERLEAEIASLKKDRDSWITTAGVLAQRAESWKKVAKQSSIDRLAIMAKDEALRAIQMRIALIGRPDEPRKPSGESDWSIELALIKAVLGMETT